MIHEDCKYWQDSFGLCGITGEERCPKKCRDYKPIYEEAIKFAQEKRKELFGNYIGNGQK